MSVLRSCVDCGRDIGDCRSNQIYCSSNCRKRAKYRRRYQRNPLKHIFRQKLSRASKRPNRFCRACGADVSWRRRALYCDSACRLRYYKPIHGRCCRKCGKSIPSSRFVCDPCLIPPKRKSGWRSYDKNPPSFEEGLRRMTRRRQAIKRHKEMVKAAYAVYRELQGRIEKPAKAPLPPPTCVVCGTTLTGFRKRILCGAPLCKLARERERSRCYYVGTPYSVTPRMIATAELRGDGKFRDIKRAQRRDKNALRLQWRQSSAAQSRREYDAYHAMKELNLIPTKENAP